MKPTYLPQALDDIARLTDQSLLAGPRTAAKFLRSLRRAVELMGASPLAGATLRGRPRSKKAIRFVALRGFRNILILYHVPAGVEVIRVVDGRRDLAEILNP